METIYALATPPGKSGVAVVRISGGGVKAALSAVLRGDFAVARFAALKRIYHPLTRQEIDRALVLFFEGPHSFTGEDVAELHIHGSRAVIKLTLEALGAVPGLCLAEPGEFSRRAFLNGKMDLTEAEGLADLIEAETAAQAKQALRQASGELKRLYEDWRARTIGLMARLEAYIDFPDEPLPPELEAEITAEVTALHAALHAHLQDGGRGERLREGARIAIIGAPNAGKSSLLNYLAQRDIAIVSPIPGTTRDALEVHLDIKGYPVTMIDTAGIREASDAIEIEGVKRSLKHAEEADIILVLVDGETFPAIPEEIKPYLKESNFIAVTKSDRGSGSLPGGFSISSITGQGVDILLDTIGNQLENLMAPGNSPLITQIRYRNEINNAASALSLYLERQNQPIELRAELLRQASAAIGRITGRIDVEDILDALFSKFCIGK